MARAKNKTIAFDKIEPWPLIFSDQAELEASVPLIRALLKSHKRFSRIRSSRKASGYNQTQKRRNAYTKEILTEYASQLREMSHIEILGRSISSLAYSPNLIVETLFYIQQMMLEADDVERDRTTNDINKGLLLSNTQFADQVSKSIYTTLNLLHEQAESKKLKETDDRKAAKQKCLLELTELLKTQPSGLTMWLASPFNSNELMDSIVEKGIHSPYFDQELANARVHRTQKVKDLFDRECEERRELIEKSFQNMSYVKAPLAKLDRSNISESAFWGAIELYWAPIAQEEIGRPFHINIQKHAREPLFKEISLSIGCAQFWYTVLTTVVTAHLRKRYDFAKGDFYKLLIEAIRGPKNAKRIRVSQELEKLRGYLATKICPILVGCHRNIENTLIAEKLASAPKEEAFLLISEYLASLFNIHNLPATPPKATTTNKIKALWQALIFPRIDIILDHLASNYSNIQRAKTTFNDIEIKYLQDLIGPEENDNEDLTWHLWSDYKPESEIAAPKHPRTQWIYCHNPWSPKNKTTQLSNSEETSEKELDKLVRDLKLNIGISSKRIIDTLHFFAAASKNPEALLETPPIRGIKWTKLPRGRGTRVLCRWDENDRLCFHLLPRKDWHPQRTPYGK